MHVSIKGDRITYDLEIFEKITIVAGDSGTGKTTFWSLTAASDEPKQIKLQGIYGKDEIF